MEKIVAYLGLFMSAFFIFMGIFIQFYPPSILVGVSPSFTVLASIVLILYGSFRLYRAVGTLRRKP